MTDGRFRTLALAAAVCVLGFAGTAAAAPTAKAKAPAAKVSAASPCDVLADDPEDPFRAAPGVEQHAIDVSKALPACQAALTADDTGGRLWYAYARVLQRAEDNKGALDAFQQAAARGYPIAENLLGVMYQNARQLDQAAVWIRKAADHGYLPAQAVLASFYLNGWGVQQDAKQALEWYRKAADKGYPLAQVTLAALYHGGTGVAQDDAMALQWARKASDQNYAPAQSMVAGMYHNGWGVKKDDKAALALYLKAAEQGYQPAQAQLGLTYHNGWGVPVDDKKAAEWLQQAADAGYQPAADLLAALRQGPAGGGK
jgi:TPR repeat protein